MSSFLCAILMLFAAFVLVIVFRLICEGLKLLIGEGRAIAVLLLFVFGLCWWFTAYGVHR